MATEIDSNRLKLAWEYVDRAGKFASSPQQSAAVDAAIGAAMGILDCAETLRNIEALLREQRDGVVA